MRNVDRFFYQSNNYINHQDHENHMATLVHIKHDLHDFKTILLLYEMDMVITPLLGYSMFILVYDVVKETISLCSFRR